MGPLGIGRTLSCIDFGAECIKLPETRGGAALFALPVAKTVFAGLTVIGKGALNTLKKVPIFDVRQSGVQSALNQAPYNPHVMQDLLQFHYPDAIITSTTLPARGMRGTAQKTLKTTAATSRKGKEKVPGQYAPQSAKGKEKVVDAGKREPHKPLLGQNPRASKHRTSTDLEGGRATAKSIFRNQTRGEKIPTKPIDKGAEMRTSKTGAKIRFKKDGSTCVELPKRGAQKNGETIHFKKPENL